MEIPCARLAGVLGSVVAALMAWAAPTTSFSQEEHRAESPAVALRIDAAGDAESLEQGERGRDGQPGGGRDAGRGGRGLIAAMGAFKTEVRPHPYNVVLVRPTPTTITASIVSNADSVGYVEWSEPLAEGADRWATEDLVNKFVHRTKMQTLGAGEPASFVIGGLRADAAYLYRWRFRDGGKPGEESFGASPAYSFHTPRPPSRADRESEFVFTVIADSHLDPAMTPTAYAQALTSALKDRPDFHIDLGDTFMTDKRGRNFKEALPQYVAQRYYLGLLCHDAPLFMVLGNHDGEAGYAARGDDNIAEWSFAQRTRLFPPPEIGVGAGGMYSGRTRMDSGAGSNYYQFTWGDAQFIVLDPFWFTTERARGGGGGGGAPEAELVSTDENWTRTLGRDQYDWLTQELEASKARYKFVFIHHLVGGRGRAARGGVESSVLFEWGGQNADGSPGFAAHRPGWAMPIHDLLSKHHVSAVFHGHDHLYVRSERDGVVYQCVPQPGNLRGNTRSAEDYGYRSGTILGSPGYLRVRIGPERAMVAFIRSGEMDGPGGQGDREGRGRRDSPPEAVGEVVHSYELLPWRDEQPHRSGPAR